MNFNTRHCVIQATEPWAHQGQQPGHPPLCNDNTPVSSPLESWEEAKTSLLILQPSAGHQSLICPLQPHPPMQQQPPQTGETRDAAELCPRAQPHTLPTADPRNLPFPREVSTSQHIPQSSLRGPPVPCTPRQRVVRRASTKGSSAANPQSRGLQRETSPKLQGHEHIPCSTQYRWGKGSRKTWGRGGGQWSLLNLCIPLNLPLHSRTWIPV